MSDGRRHTLWWIALGAIVVAVLGVTGYWVTHLPRAPIATSIPAPETSETAPVASDVAPPLPSAKAQATDTTPTTAPFIPGDAKIILPPAPIAPPSAATSNITAIAFAPDGRLVIARAGGMEYRDLASGMKQPIGLDGSGVREINLSPGGGMIAVAGGGATALWSVPTVSVRRLADAGASCARFSPDGRTVATADAGGDVKLWEVASLSAQATLRVNVGPITSIVYAADGRSIAAAGQGATVWELPANRAKTRIAVGEACTSVAFSPDGHLLAVASANGVVLWETVFWQKASTLPIGQGVNRVAFWHGGGSVVLACADGSVQIWDVATKMRTTTLAANAVGGMFALGVDDRTIATVSANGVLLWDSVARTSRALP